MTAESRNERGDPNVMHSPAHPLLIRNFGRVAIGWERVLTNTKQF